MSYHFSLCGPNACEDKTKEGNVLKINVEITKTTIKITENHADDVFDENM